MFYERLHVTFVGVVATLVDSVIVAEFAGYWLHRLLHSDKFPALSRGHLIHHFLIYGPRQPMRGWPILMFSYLHDRMHTQNFWMTRVPLLKSWFLKARRLHDIHHRSVNSKGFMDTNFGIGFYFFDRFFRTMVKRHRPFNWEGYQAAIGRYGLDETELLSLRGCSKALFHKAAQSKTALPRT